MDGAEAATDTRPSGKCDAPMSRRAWGRDAAVGVSLGETALVQILVVVANIQMRTLKTEVEKGSM